MTQDNGMDVIPVWQELSNHEVDCLIAEKQAEVLEKVLNRVMLAVSPYSIRSHLCSEIKRLHDKAEDKS